MLPAGSILLVKNKEEKRKKGRKECKEALGTSGIMEFRRSWVVQTSQQNRTPAHI
jgi:hypothetical protein